MNILFLTLSDFKNLDYRNIYTDLMSEFIKRGHTVYAISPFEKKTGSVEQVIILENLNIIRIKIGNYQKTNFFTKGLTMLTLENKILHKLRNFLINTEIDLILYSTPPITFFKTVKYLKNKSKALTYLMLKDIFPQNAIDLSILKNKFPYTILISYYRKKEKKLYGISDIIGCMSMKNVDYIKSNYYINENQIVEVLPNALKISENFEIKTKINSLIDFSLYKEKIKLIYGGNLGKPQGIDFVVEFLKSNLNNNQIITLIIGDGTEKNKIKNAIENFKISNVILMDGISKDSYHNILNQCDIGLIFLDFRFTIPNFPSRILDYMYYSKPILAATDRVTDLGKIIEMNGFGLCSYSDNIEKFNMNLKRMISMNLEEMGLKARAYLESNYSVENAYKIIMKHFEKG